MNASCRLLQALRPTLIALGALALGGCLTRRVLPPRRASAPEAPAARAFGRPYQVVPGRSRLIVLVYRAGALASLGHNHVIACRCVSGTFHVPRDVLATRFTLRIPVAQFSVDDPRLRAAQHSSAFPVNVPQAARRGTRHNMLSAAVLDAKAFPDIEIRAAGLRRSPTGNRNALRARVQIDVRGQSHWVTLHVHYRLTQDELVARGAFSIEQTSLGLTPFSVLFGALRVKNQLTVRFHLVAVPANSAGDVAPAVRPPPGVAMRRPVH